MYTFLVHVMTKLCVQLLLVPIAVLSVFGDDQECNNCYIGSTLQPSPCPECCCIQSDQLQTTTKNCCYKSAVNNHKPSETDPLPHSVLPVYFLGALASLVIVTIVMACLFRLADQKCHCFGKRKPNANRARTSDEHYSDGPPAYDNLAMDGIHIVVSESPPYIKDPPSYTEATANPTGLPEVNDNG